MAQQPQPVDAFWEQLSAPYPPPPPFWKHFTTTNLARLKDLESQPDFDPASLPYELRVLQPPTLPLHATFYTTFDKVHLIPPQPTLPPAHEELLFDPTSLTEATGTARPHARLLWQLTKSLNLNFLELHTIMADNPMDWEEKVRDIGMLMENINAVINLMRPHQAREGVKAMLSNRLAAAKEEMERCDEMKRQVEGFLTQVEEEGKTAAQALPAPGAISGLSGMGKKDNEHNHDMRKAKETWEILDRLDGD